MSTAVIATEAPLEIATTRAWEKIGNAVVLLLYSGVVLFTVRYHEKWADEAQAWLIARDLDLKTIWFHELRYEGSPGLWHTILWVVQHVFHARYGALGYIGVAFAIAGAAVLIFAAPFPRHIRWPLAFTYVMVYQYAVIARPYTLLPLLCFVVAILFKDVQHPGRMTVALVLLALLTLHGTILAGCFGLAYLLEVGKSWATLEMNVRHRFVICAAAMALTFIFIVIVLKPTADIEEFVVKKQLATLAANAQIETPTAHKKFNAIMSGAFLDWVTPSVAFVVLAAVWCFVRRRFLTITLPVGAMIAVYSMIHGAAHHHGTAFVAAIAGLWIAWPTPHEGDALNRAERRALLGMIGLLACLCAINIWDAMVVIEREYTYPYCGSKDAANYLKSVGADRGSMFGFLFGTVAVQAYFDRNLFSNIPTAYFHHGLPLYGTNLDTDQLRRVQPEYLVAYSDDPEQMAKNDFPVLDSEGYEIAHFSDGYYLYKSGVFEREVFFIFRRVRP